MRITLGEMKSHKICLILSFVCMFMGLCLFSNHVSAASISRQGGATKTASVTLEYGNADGYWSTITSSTKEQWYKFTTPYDSEGYTTIKFDNYSVGGRVDYDVYTFEHQNVYGGWAYRNGTATLNKRLDKNTTYYICVRAEYTGNFAITLTYNEDKEGSSKNTAVAIQEKASNTWTIDGKTDSDYAVFTAQKTGKHKVLLNNLSCDTLYGDNLTLEVLDFITDEQLASIDVTLGKTTSASVDLVAGKKYYLKIYNNNNSTGSYNFVLNSQKATGITLSDSSKTVLVNDSFQLNAIVLPSDAMEKTVSYFSENSEIATVDNNGKVTGNKPGTAVIRATALDDSGVSNACTVTVVKKCTIYFESNYGSSVDSQKVTSGNKVTKPAEPTRTGYAFAGWFTDKDCKNAYNFDNPVNDNMTLYAGWNVATYTVHFNTNGGTPIADQAVGYGNKVAEPAPPQLIGSKFRAWYTDASLTKKWSMISDTVKSDMTLYAGYDIDTYTVSFVSKGSVIITQTVPYGGLVAYPSNPIWLQHQFIGWFMDSNYVIPWEFNVYPVNQNITLYAAWCTSPGAKVMVGTGYYKVLTSSINGGTVEYVKPVNKKSSKLTVPSTVTIDNRTYKVTRIGKNAFNYSGNSKLKQITVGKNVTKISAGAFKNCKNLTKLTIKSSKVNSIGKNAFSGVKKKVTVKVPKKKYTSYKKMIKKAGLKKVTYKKF